MHTHVVLQHAKQPCCSGLAVYKSPVCRRCRHVCVHHDVTAPRLASCEETQQRLCPGRQAGRGGLPFTSPPSRTEARTPPVPQDWHRPPQGSAPSCHVLPHKERHE